MASPIRNDRSSDGEHPVRRQHFRLRRSVTSSQLVLTKYGYLYGEDSGVSSGVAADSLVNRGSLDLITDFHIGEDKIDLSAIDAKAGTLANDAFSFVASFSNVAGQLIKQASGLDTLILADTSGDGIAEFRILLAGNLTLTATDFIL